MKSKSLPNDVHVGRRVSDDALGHAADQPALHAASSVRADDDEIDAMLLRVLANRLGWSVVREHRELDLDVGQVLIAQLG